MKHESTENDETLPASDADRGQSSQVPAAPIDGYRLRAVIGRGGMGEVVLASDLEIGRDVAIKRMRDPQATPEDVQRFLREARIQALLDHPAIVPVHEVGTDSAGRPYFTMKRVTGRTLAVALQRGEKLQTLLRKFVDVCLAIELAHNRRIVHRDLKPANIMLGDYGEVYILDWGLARILDDNALAPAQGDSSRRQPLAAGMTQAGTVLGTPGYMAPEQVRGEPSGTAADIFALGAILFEILTGEPLYKTARSRDAVEEASSPLQRTPDRAIAPELDALCSAALASDPAARPSARALADGVQAYLDGDRDLAQRRAFASKLLAESKDALASGRRADAIHQAGRALLLDPESVEAAQAVTTLLVEPPRELPPELVASLQHEEREYMKMRSARAVPAYMTLAALAPFLPLLAVRDWTIIVTVFVVAAVLALAQWVNAKMGTVPAMPIMVGNFVLVLLFSRMVGTLVVTPLLICAIVLAIAGRINVAQRPLRVAAWGSIAWATPVLLENLDVFQSTFWLSSQGLVVSGAAITASTPLEVGVLIGGSGLLILIVAFYASAIMRGRHEALHRVHVQAWQLQQLLPQRALSA